MFFPTERFQENQVITADLSYRLSVSPIKDLTGTDDMLHCENLVKQVWTYLVFNENSKI